MLGCSLAEKAIEDLDYAAKELNRQIGGLPGQLELKTLESQLSKLQLGKEDAATLLEKLQDQKTAVEGEIETTLAQLREAASAREIQRRRDDKVKQLADISERLSSAEQSVVRWLGNKSLAVVAQRLTKQSLNFIDEASLKGRIPSPYNEDFVQELLDSKTCVCKRPLAEGSRFWVECGRARYSL
jgi:chromosome segregation ATPase